MTSREISSPIKVMANFVEQLDIPDFVSDRGEEALKYSPRVNVHFGTAAIKTHLNQASQYLILLLNGEQVNFKERQDTIPLKVYHLSRRLLGNPGSVIRRVTFTPQDGPLNYDYLPQEQREAIRRNPSDGKLYALFIVAVTNGIKYDGALSLEALSDLIRYEQERRAALQA
ncbi:uncharacterized protein LOC132194668 [Neocloeon triangulifer]|uniref:uncharacterized protein LOC132194668 n=1 Tax=Neocloeon triangulifer TaxID=2078957 RepID=UPI00286F4540|nr:uncharacterized protein LOC132194668 [Neocloeon triangulifer]